MTVSAIDPPKMEQIIYEQLQLNDMSEIQSEPQKSVSRKASSEIELQKWTRLTAQSCQIPNEFFFETEVGENGSFYVAFSNNGKYLACNLNDEYDFPILVYKVHKFY